MSDTPRTDEADWPLTINPKHIKNADDLKLVIDTALDAAIRYKAERDALQKAVDAFAAAYKRGSHIGREQFELLKLAKGAK